MHLWLFLDCSNLVYRAFHGLGGDPDPGLLAHRFFSDVDHLCGRYHTPRVAFAFDGADLYRRERLPSYKESRAPKDPAERQARQQVYEMLGRLRGALTKAGFRNVFRANGYEADDVLASLCQGLGEGEGAIIVSSDQDLYQCLGPKVKMCKPNAGMKEFTEDDFTAQYGLEPHRWAEVKALAGCAGDGVPGLKGVAEKTAAKYLRGELPTHHKTFQTITSEDGVALADRNLPLVRLPFPGCPVFLRRSDAVTVDGWRKLCKRWGLEELKRAWPRRAL